MFVYIYIYIYIYTYIYMILKIHRGFLKIAHAYKPMHIHYVYIYICNHQHVGLRSNNIAHQGTKLHVLFPNSIFIYIYIMNGLIGLRPNS